jgi:exopolysaccharide production protein ExoQ
MRYPFAIGAVLIVPFALFMPKSLTPLFILLALCGLYSGFGQIRSLAIPSKPLIVFWAGSIFLFTVSWLWSIAPYETLRLILPVAGLIFLGIVTTNLAFKIDIYERSFVCRSIAIGSTIGFIVLCVEVFSPLFFTNFFFSLFKNVKFSVSYNYETILRNGANIAALVVFPAIAVTWRSKIRPFAVMLVVLAVVTLVVSKAGGALFALLIGLTAIVVTCVFRRHVRIFFGSILIVFALAMPVIVSVLPSAGDIEERYPNFPNSVYPRIFIWQSSAKYIFENPILGKGFNSSRAISKPEDRVEYSTRVLKNTRASVPIPLHPHNAILQIWLELGFVGIGSFLALLLILIKRIEQLSSSLAMRAFAYGSFFSAFTIANVSYGIWQNWWISVLWLTTTFTIISTRDEPPLTGSHDTAP